MKTRASVDGILALPFTHHLAIGRNVPMPELLDWLNGFAPQGVIEFVPKNDPMVQHMQCLREDIFPDYSEEHFLAALDKTAEVVESEVVSAAGRLLVWYRRR